MGNSLIQSSLEWLQGHYILASAALILVYTLHQTIYLRLIASPLRQVPGPKSFGLTKWRLALADWQGTRTTLIHDLHTRYGTAVRIGPNEVSFSSLSALRTIYGAGAGFERTDFYRMFDVYGRQNLFTFGSAKAHGDRKKVLAHDYSKSAILAPGGVAKKVVETNVQGFLEMLERERGVVEEVFKSLHWYSLDSITGFLYGDIGGTRALQSDGRSRALLDDIVDPGRRALTWFAVHLNWYTKCIYSKSGIPEKFVTKLGLLPMHKPTTYTGIRAHALNAWRAFEAAPHDLKLAQEKTPMGRLWRYQESEKLPKLDGLDCASELADHFLAGIDTTSDTLMFLVWALSLPKNRQYQENLIKEVDQIAESECNSEGNPTVEAVANLPYLDAIIKETLRLYAPLPASEPRSFPRDTVVDGYQIPAGTVVSMSPYTLHRNAEVFPDPLEFRPERWLGECGDLTEMKKWFWAFSSGGRMCIGMHLAMAEMTTLIAAVYRRYTTIVGARQMGASPGITSRHEIFGDETCDHVKEHTCWIDFNPREN
ncbi:cytochrome P450 [Xylariaceae sp. FL0016]|nr:cytochrome P450 [Xylariaceae sp. FL0016]